MNAIGKKIIDAERDIAARRAELTVDQRLQPVARLNLEFGICGLDVAVEFILRDGQQAGRRVERIVFQVRAVYLRRIAAAVSTGAGVGQRTRTAFPLGIRSVRNEIKNHGAGVDDINIHPERVGCRIADPELDCGCIAELPQAFEMSCSIGGGQADGDIHHLARRHAHGKIHGWRRSHGVPACPDESVGGLPRACTVVLQAPGLGKDCARCKGRTIRYCQIGYELCRIALCRCQCRWNRL